MLVISQGKRGFIDAKALLVERVYGDKSGKYAIVAHDESLSGMSESAMIMAYFPDEKTAIDTLEKVFQAFEDGAKSYRF